MNDELREIVTRIAQLDREIRDWSLWPDVVERKERERDILVLEYREKRGL